MGDRQLHILAEQKWGFKKKRIDRSRRLVVAMAIFNVIVLGQRAHTHGINTRPFEKRTTNVALLIHQKKLFMIVSVFQSQENQLVSKQLPLVVLSRFFYFLFS